MRTRAIAIAAAVVTALSGCSAISGGGDDSTQEGSSAESSGAVTGDAEENGAKTAGIDLENPPEPVAEGTITNVSDTVDSTKIELLELRRKDNVMLATFRLTGDGRGNERTSAYRLLRDTFRPVLIDMENLEKYRNVEDLTSDLQAISDEARNTQEVIPVS